MRLFKKSDPSIVKVKTVYKSAIFIVLALILSVAAVPTRSVDAAQNFTSIPVPSTHQDSATLTTASGDFWYIYRGNTTQPYRFHVARMTPSGSTTTYDIRSLTGSTLLQVNSIIAGPDGNIWLGVYAGSAQLVKLNTSTGSATVHYLGISGYSAPRGLNVGSDGNIWTIVQHYNNKHSIVKTNPSTGTSTEAYYYNDTYGQWYGLMPTADGKLWFIDYYYKRLQSFDTSTNSLGGSYSQASLPIALANLRGLITGPDGKMWITGSITASGATTYKILKSNAPSSGFTEYVMPSGVVPSYSIVGSDGAIWFANNGSTKGIGRITTSGVINTYPAPSGTTDISDLTLGQDNALWYLSTNSSTKNVVKAEITPDFSSTPISVTHLNPAGVVTLAGDIWYRYRDSSSSTYAYHIARSTPTGTVTTYDLRSLTGNSSLQLNTIIAGPDGNIWFSGFSGSPTVGKLDITTGVATLYGTGGVSTGYSHPKGIVAGSDGNIWFTIQHYNYKHSVMKIVPSTGVVTEAYFYDDTYGQWSGLSATNDGNLWFVDAYYKRIQSFNTATNSLGTSYRFDLSPLNLTYVGDFISAPDGNTWFTGSTVSGGITSYRIFKMTSTGVFTEYNTPTGVIPSYLTVGYDGAIWFANNGTTKGLGRITTSGVISTTYAAPTGTTSLSGLRLGPDGAIWHISSNGTNNSISRFGY